MGPAWHRTGQIFKYKIIKFGSLFNFFGPASSFLVPFTGPSGSEMLLYRELSSFYCPSFYLFATTKMCYFLPHWPQWNKSKLVITTLVITFTFKTPDSPRLHLSWPEFSKQKRLNCARAWWYSADVQDSKTPTYLLSTNGRFPYFL
jgi:hypothetical protein